MTPLSIVLMVLAMSAAIILIGVGIVLERRASRQSKPLPLTPSPQAERGNKAIHQPDATRLDRKSLQLVKAIILQHPAPMLGLLETLFWLGVVATLVNHLRDPDDSAVAFVIWALTIGPHEIGHVVCMPFGWFLTVAGGSIWQVLVFVFPALYAFWARRLIAGSLVFWALTGHSLINLARYIDDARARDMPLLLGLSKDHHDWWNLLRDLDLLDYDHLLATLSEVTGASIIVLAVGVGILSTWALPRSGIGPTVRYEGQFWHAIRDRLRDTHYPPKKTKLGA